MLQKRISFHALFTTIFRRKTTNAQEAHQSQSPPSRPHRDDRDGWLDYWQKIGQPWRTEPEIDAQRQRYLAERRATVPDIERGIYPFKGMKLSRAAVEWLLATHENGRGPVDWEDESQRERKGLDLRGACLEHVDLKRLPLARLCGGLPWYQGTREITDQLEIAGVALQRADLRETHLEEAILRGTRLEHANLQRVFLQQADLSQAHLEEANLREAHLEGSILVNAHLEEAKLAHAFLEGADLRRAHLEGGHLFEAHLEGADLRRAFLDRATNLQGTFFSNARGEGVRLAGTHWGDADLTLVNWQQLKILGDEHRAQQRKKLNGQEKTRNERLYEYEGAVRANRQLAIALQTQGLNEDAIRFAYRAHVLQKSVFRFQMFQPKISFIQRLRLFGSWLFSWFLFLLAGYGYRPGRSIIAYLLMICAFALAYFLLGTTGTHHLQWYEALVVSLTAFHGRGFFAEQYKPGDPQAIIAAIEAVVGLVIEISFIATFTQRFFGK